MKKKDKKNNPRPVGLEVFINQTGDVRKDREAVDFALRDFKKKLKKSGLMQELRNREAYMSPSKYKKFRREESLRRRVSEERKTEWTRKNSSDW